MVRNNNSRLVPVPNDDRNSNYYVIGGNIVIESIEDYLIRVPIELRIPGVLITILLSEKYPTTRQFPIENFNNELIHYSVNHFYFNLGITDNCFVEFKPDPNSFLDGEKKTGRDPGVYKDISFDDDFLYYCVRGGVAGVAIWKKVVSMMTG